MTDILEQLEDPRNAGHLNRPAAAEIRQLRAERDGMTKARNRFCGNINQIGRMFWGEDKDCYAPDAVIRRVEQLRLSLDQWKRRAAFNRSVALCGETWTQEAEAKAAEAAGEGK